MHLCLLIRHSLTEQNLIEHRVIFPKSLALQACVLLEKLNEANLRTGRGHATIGTICHVISVERCNNFACLHTCGNACTSPIRLILCGIYLIKKITLNKKSCVELHVLQAVKKKALSSAVNSASHLKPHVAITVRHYRDSLA